MATNVRTRGSWKVQPASDAQLGFLKTLLHDRQVPADFAERVRAKLAAGMNKGDASAAIEWMKQLPFVPRDADGANKTMAVTEPGIFKKDGEVYLVVKSKAGRLYAKRLVNFNGTRLNENGEHVKFEWEFAGGVVWKLSMDDKMSLEEGKQFMLRYNSCLKCNRHLKAATSVERGIGPVCIKYFA
jgi:hypothetical protein